MYRNQAHFLNDHKKSAYTKCKYEIHPFATFTPFKICLPCWKIQLKIAVFWNMVAGRPS